MTDDAGPSAPDDEWDYLARDDELAGDDEEVSAEEAALHVVDEDVPRAADPGRSDVAVGDEDTAAAEAHFPDEDTGAAPARGEHEPDLEEILESQHYAFPDEGDADDG
ncbi:MAG: hypothetical protein AAFZ07_21250 [Actinomycetota bacterium]